MNIELKNQLMGDCLNLHFELLCLRFAASSSVKWTILVIPNLVIVPDSPFMEHVSYTWTLLPKLTSHY